MRKFIANLLLLLLATVLPHQLKAYDSKVNGFYFNWHGDSTCEIAASAPGEFYYVGDIIIPPSVNYNGITYTVTKTEGWAFAGCAITSVKFPKTIIEIGGGTFQNCHGLTYVDIPNTITKIWDYTFCDTRLTSVNIPNSVDEIGAFAFNHCSALTSVSIPESVTLVDLDTFSDCESLGLFISRNAIPPICYDESFSNKTYRDCKLIVPIGSVDAYKAAAGWKNFWNIYTSEEYSRITEVSATYAVTTSVVGHTICVRHCDSVRIMTISGLIVHEGNGDCCVNASPGVYLVVADSVVSKVVVR